MINEGRGISDIIKEDVDKIYELFLDNSFSTNIYKFGKEKLGFDYFEVAWSSFKLDHTFQQRERDLKLDVILDFPF